MTTDLFVFADTMSAGGRLKLNKINEQAYELFYVGADNTKYPPTIIDLASIASGTVAMVLFSPLKNKLFIHYGFSCVCELMGCTTSEMLSICGVNGMLQADRYGDRVFIKVFLPKGQTTLESDTDSYADNLYCTENEISALDWQYIPTVDVDFCRVVDGVLNVELNVCEPVVAEANENMFANYCGNTVHLRVGVNKLSFGYIRGECIYIGTPRSRRVGRAINIEEVLEWNKSA